jgi:dTDP-4-amino-4,6-dideoxygalactose transaminase
MLSRGRLSDRRCAAAVLMSLRVPGQGTDKYDNVRIGMNALLDTIQAAVPSSPKLRTRYFPQ